MRDCKAITPLQKVLSNEVSLTCSKNLMSALNKTGLSFSYSKDLKDSKVARHMWNTVGVKSSLQNTPSNVHWIETDNLETMLKSTSIHNAERLTHFLTSQLEYVNGQQVFLDLFKRPEAQHIDTAVFHLTSQEKNEHLKFLKVCFSKVVELHEFLSCDEIVCGLAQSSDNDNTNIPPLTINHSGMPSERILQRETVFPKSNTVYLRMEKLCSSNISDVKKLLDLTSNDYGLNELCYIPSIATSPFLFVSNQLNQKTISANARNELSMSPVYFIPWGFVDNPTTKSDPVKISDNEKGSKKIITIIVEKLKYHRYGVFIATSLIEALLEHANKQPSVYSESDYMIFSIIYEELLRKQGFVAKSRDLLIDLYCRILKLEDIKSSLFAKFNSVSQRQLCNSILMNAANCSLQLDSAQHCMDILAAVALQEGDIIDTYHFICANSLTSSAFACQGNFTAALEKAELCCDTLTAKLPGNHSILAIAFNQLGVILAACKKFEEAIINFER